MKTTPLKGKVFTLCDLYERDNEGKYKGYLLFEERIIKAKDIQSAVEWLKEEMSYLKRVHKYPAKDVYKFLCEKIDKAFEDVTK